MARSIELSHPDKILFPDIQWSKSDVAAFYHDLSEYLLPHLKNRPVILQRYTDGIGKKGFYQQEIPDYYPEWIKRVKVERKGTDDQDMLLLDTQTALLYVVNQDGICFHRWNSAVEAPEKPNFLVYDLDPPEDDLTPVIKAARHLRDFFNEKETEPFVMTTGSKGLHVVVPIKAEHTYDEVRQGAKQIAEKLVERYPELLTVQIRKEKRGGKIFLDYLRNSYGQATISPYSLRGIESAPVATPLDWEELEDKSLSSKSYHAKNILRRLAQKNDPWKEIHRHRVSMGKLWINS